MKSALMNTKDFIVKLDKLNFIAVDGKALISEEGFKISYSTKLQTLFTGSGENYFVGLPVQLIFTIEKDGQYVQSWGCVDLDDTTELASWYQLKKSKVQNTQYERESKARRNAEIIWESI